MNRISLQFLQVFLFVISIPVLGLAVLIEERSSVERDLRESRQKLRENYEEVQFLAGKLISAQDDERKRIALELHDDVVQRLALLAVRVENLDATVPANMTQTHNALLELRKETDQATATLRALSYQLHSSALQYIHLPCALEEPCRRLSQQHQITVKVKAEETDGSSYAMNLCLFRIAQEALSNIVKHSKAGEATVHLARNAGQLRLEIRDDGMGFNPSELSNGLGLISMRERVRLLNGTILIASRATEGTSIRVSIPLLSEPGTEPVAGVELG